MSNIFFATLGQRPEAITMALELLDERFVFEKIVILHTEPHASGIADAFQALEGFFNGDDRFRSHELTHENGAPLLDINDRHSAWAYYQSIFTILRQYKQDRYRIHLLVAGGRKAMSIYATLAASLIFGERDKVWTVLSSPRLVQQRGVFRIPAGMREQVQLVQLPVLPARLAPSGMNSPLLDDFQELVKRRQNSRADFVSRLTTEEQRLVETLTQHPQATNKELGAILNKSGRTIENQLSKIYDRMSGFLDFGKNITHKQRQVLLDILLERLD
jgi:CRISPR-associated protein (TIGR02584 family)